MKMNFLKIAAIAIAISASAFTNAKSTRSAQWVFIGNTQGDILDYTQYSQTVSEPSSCGSGFNLPCTVSLPGIEDETALESYLQSGVTANDIKDQSNALRN